MSSILHVLRRGSPRRRLQAWGGLLLIAFSVIWAIQVVIWDILGILAVFSCGAYLLARSLRRSRPSS